MHFVQAKGILSAANGMNLYRGCTHGCIYCDARSACYHIEHAFEDIEVKENAPLLLEEALRKKRKPVMVGTGAMCNPYMPIEEELGLTRRCAEIILSQGCGFAVQTKSARILRDLDLIREIDLRGKAVVQITLTTFDEALCRKLEPNVSTTAQRIEVLQRFRDAGVPTVVWLSPLLPFINDTRENLMGILNACAQTGVKGIINFGMGLTLRQGNREYFYHCLDRLFPGLKEEYIRRYGDSYEVASPNNDALTRLFLNFCAQHHILTGNDALFAYLHAYEQRAQLSLF